jgi:hypothetical protein
MQAVAWLADEARNASRTTTTSEHRGSRKGRKSEAQARNEEYMIYIIVGKERVTEEDSGGGETSVLQHPLSWALDRPLDCLPVWTAGLT